MSKTKTIMASDKLDVRNIYGVSITHKAHIGYSDPDPSTFATVSSYVEAVFKAREILLCDILAIDRNSISYIESVTGAQRNTPGSAITYFPRREVGHDLSLNDLERAPKPKHIAQYGVQIHLGQVTLPFLPSDNTTLAPLAFRYSEHRSLIISIVTKDHSNDPTPKPLATKAPAVPGYVYHQEDVEEQADENDDDNDDDEDDEDFGRPKSPQDSLNTAIKKGKALNTGSRTTLPIKYNKNTVASLDTLWGLKVTDSYITALREYELVPVGNNPLMCLFKLVIGATRDDELMPLFEAALDEVKSVAFRQLPKEFYLVGVHTFDSAENKARFLLVHEACVNSGMRKKRPFLAALFFGLIGWSEEAEVFYDACMEASGRNLSITLPNMAGGVYRQGTKANGKFFQLHLPNMPPPALAVPAPAPAPVPQYRPTLQSVCIECHSALPANDFAGLLDSRGVLCVACTEKADQAEHMDMDLECQLELDVRKELSSSAANDDPLDLASLPPMTPPVTTTTTTKRSREEPRRRPELEISEIVEVLNEQVRKGCMLPLEVRFFEKLKLLDWKDEFNSLPIDTTECETLLHNIYVNGITQLWDRNRPLSADERKSVCYDKMMCDEHVDQPLSFCVGCHETLCRKCPDQLGTFADASHLHLYCEDCEDLYCQVHITHPLSTCTNCKKSTFCSLCTGESAYCAGCLHDMERCVTHMDHIVSHCLSCKSAICSLCEPNSTKTMCRNCAAERKCPAHPEIAILPCSYCLENCCVMCAPACRFGNKCEPGIEAEDCEETEHEDGRVFLCDECNYVCCAECSRGDLYVSLDRKHFACQRCTEEMDHDQDSYYPTCHMATHYAQPLLECTQCKLYICCQACHPQRSKCNSCAGIELLWENSCTESVYNLQRNYKELRSLLWRGEELEAKVGAKCASMFTYAYQLYVAFHEKRRPLAETFAKGKLNYKDVTICSLGGFEVYWNGLNGAPKSLWDLVHPDPTDDLEQLHEVAMRDVTRRCVLKMDNRTRKAEARIGSYSRGTGRHQAEYQVLCDMWMELSEPLRVLFIGFDTVYDLACKEIGRDFDEMLCEITTIEPTLLFVDDAHASQNLYLDLIRSTGAPESLADLIADWPKLDYSDRPARLEAVMDELVPFVTAAKAKAPYDANDLAALKDDFMDQEEDDDEDDEPDSQSADEDRKRKALKPLGFGDAGKRELLDWLMPIMARVVREEIKRDRETK